MIRRSSLRTSLVIILLILALAATVTFRGVGAWLIREDPLAPADVIVVLSGSVPARAERAAAIFRMRDAPEVWITRPESSASALEQLGIRYTGEEDYNREVLIREGVPAADIRILPESIINTEQEVEEISRQMRQDGKTSVIVVTSPQHTRRVRALWRRLVGDSPKAVIRAAWEDPFDSRHWWRNTRDTFAVVREVLGLLNVWVGMPVRPHASPDSRS